MERAIMAIGAEDVDALLDVAGCVEAVEDVFRAWGAGEVEPPKVLGVHVEGGGFHIKAGVLRRGSKSYFAAKANGNFPGNPARGLPSIQGLIVLADAADGTPLALLDSIRITELRTAAATAVAARWLAREGASSVTLIGCGAQAASQLRALAHVCALGEVQLVDLDHERAVALAERIRGELGVPVRVETDLAAAVRRADVTVACTTSKAAFLTDAMVPAGAFVAAVGADNPEKHEIHPSLLANARVVVDSLDQCAAIGDLHHALASGAMDRGSVHAELGAVVAGRAPGRTDPSERFVFDSTGTALQDVAAAAIVYERAVASGRGQRLALAPA
jgi:ornithine cyclodeaminase/alanine dehydrogenase-like protein (mu-crystallin family)